MTKILCCVIALFLASESIAASLDMYGGDVRVKSKTTNQGVTFIGNSTSLAADTLTDTSANFPTDGRLIGKFVWPNTNAGYVERWYKIISNTQTSVTVDISGGGTLLEAASAGKPYHITGTFNLERIGDRWWFIDPEGNSFFPKAVSLTGDAYAYDTLVAYDAVYLKTNNIFTENLKNKAENTYPGDVVNGSGISLQSTGDEIYIGSRMAFNATYINLQQLGIGGTVQWYYSSSGNTWSLINSTGNPVGGSKLNTNLSYNLDSGNYFAPSATTGFLVGGQSTANRLKWFNYVSTYSGGTGKTFPVDFVPVSVNGSAPLFYIKGVVAAPFTTPPIVSQIYDPSKIGDMIYAKYGDNGQDPFMNWLKATNQRFRAWGLNSAGMYSDRYVVKSTYSPFDRMPFENAYQISMYALNAKVKNVYANDPLYVGTTPDMFDPVYKTLVETKINTISPNPWQFLLIADEADHVFGLNNVGHQHMGYVVLATNPCRSTYTDKMLYSKYALRDLLRYKYKTPTDPIAPFTITTTTPAFTYSQSPASDELAALQALNRAWGTNYTTWGSSSGDLSICTNAWGTGTGFMDEKGAGVLTPPERWDNVAYTSFNKPGFGAVKDDLDSFVALFAAKYGSILYPALKQRVGSTPIAYPFYNPPDFVASAVKSYSDIMWINALPSRAREIYNAYQKPIYMSDYLRANDDSPGGNFGGTVSEVSYNSSTNKTTISWAGKPYKLLKKGWPLSFPDSTCTNPNPSPTKVNWLSLEVTGNYTCVHSGERIKTLNERLDRPLTHNNVNQATRAESFQAVFEDAVFSPAADGIKFIAGWEHWGYYDFGEMHPVEVTQYGLVTNRDNAYDGVEASTSVTLDVNGRYVGGEDSNYGNLIGPLSVYLLDAHERLCAAPINPNLPSPPKALREVKGL